MKFRVLASYLITHTRYYVQYKKWLFWKTVSKYHDEYEPKAFYSKEEAEQMIEKYKYEYDKYKAQQ